MNNVAPENHMEVDDVMTYTQTKRVMVVEQLTKFGTLTQDPKEMNVLLKALDGMDKAASSRKRLNIDEKTQLSTEEGLRQSADLLKSIRHKMFEAVDGTAPRPAPDLANQLPPIELVPGETEIGVAGLTYDSFMQGLPVAEES